jgi:hypothetical protein
MPKKNSVVSSKKTTKKSKSLPKPGGVRKKTPLATRRTKRIKDLLTWVDKTTREDPEHELLWLKALEEEQWGEIIEVKEIPTTYQECVHLDDLRYTKVCKNGMHLMRCKCDLEIKFRPLPDPDKCPNCSFDWKTNGRDCGCWENGLLEEPIQKAIEEREK